MDLLPSVVWSGSSKAQRRTSSFSVGSLIAYLLLMPVILFVFHSVTISFADLSFLFTRRRIGPSSHLFFIRLVLSTWRSRTQEYHLLL